MQGNYFQPEIECASREVMHYIQSKRLRRLWNAAIRMSRFTESAWMKWGFFRAISRKLRMSESFPSQQKQICAITIPLDCSRFRRHSWPAFMLRPAPPASKQSSATPRRILTAWATGAARSIVMVGGTKEDFVHVSYGYGLFTRRPWPALWRGKAGSNGDPRLLRQHQAPGTDFAGLWLRHSVLHTVVRDVYRRDGARYGHRPHDASGARRYFRCGALDGADAQGDRAAARHPCF